MLQQIYVISGADRPACNWIQTGDPKMPLTCVWTVSDARPTEGAGRVDLCA